MGGGGGEPASREAEGDGEVAPPGGRRGHRFGRHPVHGSPAEAGKRERSAGEGKRVSSSPQSSELFPPTAALGVGQWGYMWHSDNPLSMMSVSSLTPHGSWARTTHCP